MDIIDVIVDKLVKKYGADSKEFAYDEDKFLRLFLAEYNVIINKSSAGYDMITNPEYLTNNIPVNNIEGLKKAIDKRLFSTLYTNNIISESEYMELCKKKNMEIM